VNDLPSEPTARPPPKRAGLLFQLTALSGAAFGVTILAFVATTFGDARAPATKWFNQHVGTLIAVEVVATLLLGLAAMIQDRTRTLKEEMKDRR
jgi:membrane protein DedA with SNARE-associated domain